VKEILERGKIEYLVCKHIYGMKILQSAMKMLPDVWHML